jgi:D-3-phosphoglycerate dehydrogenase
LPANCLLTQLENVILTPHMAAHTDEALYRMAMVAEDVLAVIDGRPPKNPVPPPSSDTPSV